MYNVIKRTMIYYNIYIKDLKVDYINSIQVYKHTIQNKTNDNKRDYADDNTRDYTYNIPYSNLRDIGSIM